MLSQTNSADFQKIFGRNNSATRRTWQTPCKNSGEAKNIWWGFLGRNFLESSQKFKKLRNRKETFQLCQVLQQKTKTARKT